MFLTLNLSIDNVSNNMNDTLESKGNKPASPTMIDKNSLALCFTGQILFACDIFTQIDVLTYHSINNTLGCFSVTLI